MDFKKALTKRTIVWGATSLFLIALVTAANIVTRSVYPDLIDGALGGDRPITKVSEDSLDFGQTFGTKKEAYNNANEVVKEICEEGMILLRNENNALPLKKNAKVSVFGKNSVNLVYGGSGSAAPGSDNNDRKTIKESLEKAGFSVNPTLVNFYNGSKSGSGRDANPAMENGGVKNLKTGETPVSSYTPEITSSYDEYGDAALVVFSRIAGENWDLPRVASDDPSRTYLDLDNNERDLLRHIVNSNKFEHIVILLNGSNYIDLGFLKDGSTDPVAANKIDACINIGSPGANGIMALGEILSGEVNPSGHTVDIVYTNYKNDPTFQNFGGGLDLTSDYYYAPDGTQKDYHFVEYEENIYMGYRYYETRGKDNPTWYNENVVYPFGYGLSYTTFTEEIVNKSELESAALTANEKFEVQVKVKNTGDVKGKQVVQLYVEAPYTAGGIEKPYKVLAGFAKTPLLSKNEEKTVTIEVDPYYFASFDNTDANGDGFKGYTLDAGNYVFHVATDSHNDIDTFTKNLATTAKIEKDPVTNNKVEVLFDDVTNGMKSNMSRTDWVGTFPTSPTDADRVVQIADLDILDSYESGNNVAEDKFALPTMGAEYTIKLKELVGKEYDDELWNQFMDQLTFDEMLKIFNEGCYKTTDIRREIDGEEEIIIPATTSCDGPTGFVAFLGDPAVYGCCYYCSECLVAQTYNLELATEQAHAIGEESLVGNEKTTLSYPGWYAPGVNLHRSPFSGRNTEYYSEDPFVCGRFAGTVIKGVQEKGVYANVKHFALNDQETHRSAKGIATWCNEQAMRELYLRSFEMAVKEGKSKGLMTSFNRIGYRWAGGDYRLCTTVLRDEWGFVGSIICDFHTDDYMDSKQMLYAGGDINLCGADNLKLKSGSGKTKVSPTNAKDATLVRRAAKNVLYCIVNSNMMKAEVIGYNPAYWKVALTIGTITIGVGIVGWGTWAILSSLKRKEEAVAAPTAE